MNGYQIEVRCRVKGWVGKTLYSMPRQPRCRVIAGILGAYAEGIDLEAFIGARGELLRLGVAVNQSLRFCHATGKIDAELRARIVEALDLIDSICHASQEAM